MCQLASYPAIGQLTFLNYSITQQLINWHFSINLLPSNWSIEIPQLINYLVIGQLTIFNYSNTEEIGLLQLQDKKSKNPTKYENLEEL